MRLDAAERGGLEIGDDDDALPDEVFWRVVFGDPRNDLARLASEIDLQLEEPVRALDALRGGDFGDAQVDLGKVSDVEQRRCCLLYTSPSPRD